MVTDADAQPSMDAAWQRFDAGDLTGAMALAREALSVPDLAVDASAALGFFLLQIDALDEAAAVLLPALAQHPEHAPLHWYTGYLLQRQGDTQAAAASFEHACLLDGTLDEAAYALAWALHDVGRTDEALAWALKALARARLPPRLLQVGWLQQATGQTEQAIASYQQAIESFDVEALEQARLHLYLGRLQHERGDLAAADQSLAEALKRQPDLADALLRRARIQWGWEKFGEARTLLEQIPAHAPEHAEAQELLAQVLLDLDDADAARRVLLPHLRATAPGSAGAWWLLAVAQSQRDRPRQALRALHRAFDLGSDNEHALRMLFALTQSKADAERGAQAIQVFASRWPDDAALQLRAALLLTQAMQLDAAASCAERAVAGAPDMAEAWHALSRIRLLQRDPERALPAVQQALQLAPTQSRYLRQLGWVLMDLTEHDQARQAFLRAVQGDSGDSEARLALAQSQYLVCDFEAGLANVVQLPATAEALELEVRLRTEGGLDGAVDACARLIRHDRLAPAAVMAALRLVGLGNADARRLLVLLPVALLQSCWRQAIELAVHTRGHAYLTHLVTAALEELDDDPWLRAAALYTASLSQDTEPHALAREARAAHLALKLHAPTTHLRLTRVDAADSGVPRIAYVAGQLHHGLLSRVLSAHAPDCATVFLFAHESSAWPGLPLHVQRQALDPATLAASCAANHIDVVIDAGGLHPFEGQFELLQAYARRVAPVQVGWLGCWGSAGGLFDALLADDVSVPAGREAQLQESVLRLAGGQWCWDPPADAPPTGVPPSLARGSTTFGVTARSLKLDQACIGAFAAVVAATPGSTIRFAGQISVDWPERRQVLRQMQTAGVAADRVSFDAFMPHAAYLQWLGGIDLVLDSFPGNGGLSMLDPLWMGVPVVTLAGAWPGARQGASVLSALGLAGWVASTTDAFCATVTALAADTPALATHRSTLRARILASPLLDGRRVAAQIEDLCRDLKRRFAPVAQAPDPKSRVKEHARLALDAWLVQPRTIALPSPEPGVEVELSVIMMLFNQAGLSRSALQSLADQRGVRFETLIVDNASTDRTPELLARLSGAHVMRNSSNAGFLHAACQGAAAASGHYLVFVNNDVVLEQGALQATLDTLRRDPSIGALGARVVLAAGGLQEAGNKIFGDGSAGGIGRGENPFAHAALAGRSTDYVSGVFLATPASLWRALGGFDERLAPAYYEDTNYCLRVWRAGFRVWYEPSVIVEHLESGSASGDSAAQLMELNRKRFSALHAPWLATQPAPRPLPLNGDNWAAPEDQPRRPRVLFIDNEVPFKFKGGGLPRARLMLQALCDWPVTLYPLWEKQELWHAIYAAVPPTVEVALGHGLAGLEAFLEQRRGVYGVLLVSRPTNLSALQPLRARRPELFDGMRLVYDAEALFALREVAMAGVQGRPLTRIAARARIDAELALADGADDVLVVSERDAGYFRAAGHRTHTLSHSAAAQRDAPGPVGRSGLLFIGALHPDTPNEDGILWFIREVMPRLRQRGPASPVLAIVGLCLSERVAALAAHDVKIVGAVDDLAPCYAAARVFVAPVRFAGGVPVKVIEAAAAGLPVVASALLVRQLGWRDGSEIMGARDAQTFASSIDQLLEEDGAWRHQQAAAWNVCAERYAPEQFAATLHSVLNGGVGGANPANGDIPSIALVQARNAVLSMRPADQSTSSSSTAQTGSIAPPGPPAHPAQRPALARYARLMSRGKQEDATAALQQALAVEPNLPLVHLALARLRWPGPDYKHWLAWLHRELQPRVYLEIGVEKGESLALANAPTQVIGVDPAPVGDPLAHCTAPARLHRQTSAQFLAAPPADCGLHDHGFDLAFVDGDHSLAGVLDDVIALQAWAAPGALLVLHDTWPLNALTAAPQRNSGFYSGDGWKIVPCLRALQPGLKVVTLPIAPTGLTLVAGLDPNSRVLQERRVDILAAYAGLDARRAVEQAESTLGPVGLNDEVWVRRWVDEAGVVPRR